MLPLNRQRLLAAMLRQDASGKRCSIANVELSVEMLDAAGMDEDARRRWHAEFERRAPEGHREFLLSLGIPANEAERIQRWSRGETDHY